MITLTKRELEITQILAEGKSNKGIARRLNITEGTVKIHLNNIYRKVGVMNRFALIVMTLKGQYAEEVDQRKQAYP
jgi:two-component system nitrate/nitrite response regulator NarL